MQIRDPTDSSFGNGDDRAWRVSRLFPKDKRDSFESRIDPGREFSESRSGERTIDRIIDPRILVEHAKPFAAVSKYIFNRPTGNPFSVLLISSSRITFFPNAPLRLGSRINYLNWRSRCGWNESYVTTCVVCPIALPPLSFVD